MKPSGTMTGLDGIAEKSVDCYAAKSRAEMKRILRAGNVAVAAGNRASMTVWWGDDEVIRGEVHRFGATIRKDTFRTLDAAYRWIQDKWELLGDLDKLAVGGC